MYLQHSSSVTFSRKFEPIFLEAVRENTPLDNYSSSGEKNVVYFRGQFITRMIPRTVAATEPEDVMHCMLYMFFCLDAQSRPMRLPVWFMLKPHGQ